MKNASYSDPTPPAVPSNNTGKRTYADAALSPLRPADNSLPLSLEHSKRRRKASLHRRKSLFDRLNSRELGIDKYRPDLVFAQEIFRSFQLQMFFDTHKQTTSPTDQQPSIVLNRRRMNIIEIAASRELIFSLSANGLCSVFNRDLGRQISHMNVTEDEVIRSLFLNKTNNTVITVSVFEKDEFSSLHCRSIPLTDVRNGNLKSGVAIFESECLKWPGFIEFDDVNGKILTFSAEGRKYKVWDLETYNHLYTIPYEGIEEIKISPGIMLIIFRRQDSHVPIRILDIDTGAQLREINHMVHRKRKIDFIEQFHEKLLVKQENENLQIIDVLTGRRIDVEHSHFLLPNAFIFLYESEHFLTFQRREVSVWNFQGDRITTFEDHTLFHSDSIASSIYITQQQDMIISYCQQEGDCNHGSINVSSIETGKALGKITCGPNHSPDHINGLKGISCLYYNEERNEIYSGSKDGHLYVWSN
eukprot:GFKZ01002942.1.p1 GENE.GFKZ01002942.1~~GFKZ01002942.1.p1  ORF type:complete len:474 (+),score=66.82 GFKZ01002942.1:233-1654(+)